MGLTLTNGQWALLPDSSPGFTWRQITDLSTLTFSDPNSLVLNYSVLDGLHSLTMATLAASNIDYNFGSGTNFTGARYYFPLTYSDGSIVQAGDAFNWSMKVTNFAVGAARTWHLAWGCVQNATSTTLNTMDGMGNTFGMSGVGTPLAGTWRRNTVNTTSLAGGDKVYGNALFGGLPGKTKISAQTTIQGASSQAATNGLDANSWTVADNSQVYAILAIGSLGTATTTGGQIDFKLYYNVDKLS
jgi:hypothetical protein